MKPQHDNLITARPKIKGLKAEILALLQRHGACCSFEIQLLLNKPQLIQVSRRLTELENDGLIIRTGVIKNARNMKYDEFITVTPGTEDFHRQRRHEKMHKTWLKQGLSKGYINSFTYDSMVENLI